MLDLSPLALAVFVPELWALQMPQEEMAVPASFFTDKAPALLVLLLIQRNWKFQPVPKKAAFCIQKHSSPQQTQKITTKET